MPVRKQRSRMSPLQGKVFRKHGPRSSSDPRRLPMARPDQRDQVLVAHILRNVGQPGALDDREQVVLHEAQVEHHLQVAPPLGDFSSTSEILVSPTALPSRARRTKRERLGSSFAWARALVPEQSAY